MVMAQCSKANLGQKNHTGMVQSLGVSSNHLYYAPVGTSCSYCIVVYCKNPGAYSTCTMLHNLPVIGLPVLETCTESHPLALA